MGVYSVYIDPIAERRLNVIAAEKSVPVADLISRAAAEAALEEFRHRRDDPGRPPQPRQVA